MPELLDPRSAASGQNFKTYFGVNQKEYGTSLWATSTSAFFTTAPTMIFAATFPGISVLEVATPVQLYQYAASADNYMIDGQTYTGTYNDYWSAVMFNNAMIFTNGKDPMQIKQNYNSTATQLASAVSPTTFNAWCIQGLNGYLNLYHTFENQSEFYKRVRWSAQAPLTYTAGTADFGSGVAGAQDLDDGEGNRMQAVPLAGGMVIYFENSVHYQYFVGGDQVWQFQKMVPGVGIPSRRAALGYQEVNFFISNNNIYRYYGGYYLDPIGEPIKQALFAELNQAAINTIWLDYDKREAELLVNIPTGTSSTPNVTWVYRVADKAWSRRIRSHSSGTIYGKQNGLTYGQVTTPFGGQNYTFGDCSVQIGAATKLYGDINGRVVKTDVTVYSQSIAGTQVAQTYVYDTPDLTGRGQQDPQEEDHVDFMSTNQRWQRLTTEIYGTGQMGILYSTNHGVTFTPLAQSPVNLSNTAQTYMLDMDVSNPYIRIRYTNSGLNDFVAVRYARLDFIPGAQV